MPQPTFRLPPRVGTTYLSLKTGMPGESVTVLFYFCIRDFYFIPEKGYSPEFYLSGTAISRQFHGDYWHKKMVSNFVTKSDLRKTFDKISG